MDYSTAAFIGGPESELINGTKVEAEGPIVSGTLQAEKVKFKESNKDDDFKDDDTVIGRTAFFNRLVERDLVKASFRAGAWDQIEFED